MGSPYDYIKPENTALGDKEFCTKCSKSYPSQTYHECYDFTDNIEDTLQEPKKTLPEVAETLAKALPTRRTLSSPNTKSIPKELYNKFNYLGLIPNDVRKDNAGKSNYSDHTIQPWTIWLDYPELTPWDHDIIKRAMRQKATDSRKLDYEKIIHICQERIRQIDLEETNGK